mmetsp:Transcript_36296/g.66707  ORF Transcript_36296/g.66707 Transcript_36296/m.66707 type:complete len:324 (+) Transcript_36296:186-1157(+)
MDDGPLFRFDGGSANGSTSGGGFTSSIFSEDKLLPYDSFVDDDSVVEGEQLPVDEEDDMVHATSTPHSSSQSNDIQRLLSKLVELESTCNRFQTFFGAGLASPMRLTLGRTFTFFLLRFDTGNVDTPIEGVVTSSSQRRMHQLSAHAIHDRATRFFKPLRIFSSIPMKEAERLNDVDSEDDVERVVDRGSFVESGLVLVVVLPRVELISISIRMERPCGAIWEDDDDDEEGDSRVFVSLLLLVAVSGLSLPLPFEGVLFLAAAISFSKSMRRIMVADIVDGALSKSKEEMCFIFKEPREPEEHANTSGACSFCRCRFSYLLSK